MNTYLFVWNPKFWSWENLERNIVEVYKTETYIEDWSCGVTKSVPLSSRFFLIKIGTDSKSKVKGIIGSGTIVSEAYYKTSVKNPNKETLHVDLQFDNLLNPYKEDILPLDILLTGNLSSQHWTSQSSGIIIKPQIIDELEALWFDLLSIVRIKNNPYNSEELENKKIFNEGFASQITLTRYERNRYARKVCLERWGYSCSVCRFNFEKAYGDIGKNFIQVHHLNQIAKVGKEYQINPIEDLLPVCPNCHAMLHRRIPIFSIEELRLLMNRY